MSSNHFNVMQLLFREQKVVGIFKPEEIGTAHSHITHAAVHLEMLPNNSSRKGKFQSARTRTVSKAVPIENAAFRPEFVNGSATACPICKLISKSVCNKLFHERTYKRVFCHSPVPLLKIPN